MDEFAQKLNIVSNGELAETLVARYGLFVFPCHERTFDFVKDGKQVIVKAKTPRASHNGVVIIPDGMNSATNDFGTVSHWWVLWPGALVGINLKMSGLIAIDCDVPGASHPDLTVNGIAEFTRLAGAAGELTAPCWGQQNTPSGGMQVLYSFPRIDGVPGALCAGIDIKHDGYVCTGRMADGKRYTWIYAPKCGAVRVPAPFFVREFIAHALHAASAPAPVKKTKRVKRAGHGISVFDDYNARANWDDILTGHGEVGRNKSKTGVNLTRPGKTCGVSAVVFDGGRLYVNSTNWPALPRDPKGYSKFDAYCQLRHNGDVKATIKELLNLGYGSKL